MKPRYVLLIIGTVLIIGIVGSSFLSASKSFATTENIAHFGTDILSPITRKKPEKVVFELETREIIGELAPGVSYEYWTYNGTVPGPFFRVREGDTVEIRLAHTHGHTENNASHGKHSIDLHAVIGPGGGAVNTQVAAGEEKSFEFQALRPGLYVYHCASPHVPTHVANGMYGLILVEPKEGLLKVDREFYMMQGEWYTKGALGTKGFQPFSPEKLLLEQPEYFTFNGSVGALTGKNALTAKAGEKIRIFFGVGSQKASNFHIIGGVLDALYPEGDILSPPHQNVQTTIVPAGGAVMAEFTINIPGTYLFVDHSLSRAIDRGAIAELIITP